MCKFLYMTMLHYEVNKSISRRPFWVDIKCLTSKLHCYEIHYCAKIVRSFAVYCELITNVHDMLTCVDKRAAVVAWSTVWWSVDGCWSAHSAATRDPTPTSAADNRRHRAVVF